MAISDKDRKLLWGRSHNRCAHCKQLLSVEERTDDRAAIVGDEAHIVSGAKTGPRSSSSVKSGIDSYENLILLCKTDHKMVDDQPNEFTVDLLLEMKKSHESEMEEYFSSKRGWTSVPPVRVIDDPEAPDMPFVWLEKGLEVWDLISSATSFAYKTLDEVSSNAQQQDAADDFLDLVQQYQDASIDVVLDGAKAIRSAQREFEEKLDILHGLGLVVFGRSLRRIVTGGVLPDSFWMQAELLLLHADNELAMMAEGRGIKPKAGS